MWNYVSQWKINYIFWIHIAFIIYSVLGEIGILYGALPQHFFFTVGGVSNLAVATRPVLETFASR